MIAKFTRGTDHRLGIRFEPESFEEQLLVEQFTRDATRLGHEFRFSSWEQNNQARALREGLTSVWGEILEHARHRDDRPQSPIQQNCEGAPVMGMATPDRFATPFTFELIARPTDDPELTCLVCRRQDVTHQLELRGHGRREWIGIHVDCAESIGAARALSAEVSQ